MSLDLTSEQLRALARASFLLMDSPVVRESAEADPLRTVLPGDGSAPATAQQIAAVDEALSPRGLVVRRLRDGSNVWPNVALLRSQLRRWAARQGNGDPS